MKRILIYRDGPWNSPDKSDAALKSTICEKATASALYLCGEAFMTRERQRAKCSIYEAKRLKEENAGQ